MVCTSLSQSSFGQFVLELCDKTINYYYFVLLKNVYKGTALNLPLLSASGFVNIFSAPVLN